MKITIADTFWKSMDTMRRHETWWYKIYDTLTYRVPFFFKNLWYFRKELWEFRGWDYSFNLRLLSRSLEKTAYVMEHHGSEVEIYRMRKVNKIKRAVEILNSIRESVYIDKAEEQVGEIKNLDGWRMDREDTQEEREHNKKVFKLARRIEDAEWNELWDILRGQNHQEYVDLMNNLSDEEKEKGDVWNEWHDGSGMRGWWD